MAQVLTNSNESQEKNQTLQSNKPLLSLFSDYDYEELESCGASMMIPRVRLLLRPNPFAAWSRMTRHMRPPGGHEVWVHIVVRGVRVVGGAEQQRLLCREQDETISQLSRTVERVQGMAVRVNDELREQHKLIGEIDDDVERTDSRLKSLHGKLRHLANDSDRGKYCLIVVLLN